MVSGNRKTFGLISSIRTLGSVASLLSATLFQGNHDMNHKLWNRINLEIYNSYGGGAGMLLNVNGKFTMIKLKSSLVKFRS